MSFKYKVNSRLVHPLRLLNNNEERRGSFTVELEAHGEVEGQVSIGSTNSQQREIVTYPLIRNLSRKESVRGRARKGAKTKAEEPEIIEPEVDPVSDSELQISIELDFGWIFGWLERIIWATMIVSVGWALIYNFEKATSEVCYVDEFGIKAENYPLNILPSLSRSMSSFRVGKFIWTITMAGVFVARLLSNHFLHRLYETWYAHNWFNKVYLNIAYALDTLEIISLVMIPAFSLDCDPNEHSVFFRVFICLTFAAELLQYFTRFLSRKKGIVLFSEDVNNYYKQIGILIILQMVFIGVMVAGYKLHDIMCDDLYYSIFTFGEYITVVINVRFKRDTVLFVK